MLQITRDKDAVKQMIEGMLGRYYNITPQEANKEQMYKAAAMAVQKLLKSCRQDRGGKEGKKVYYFCLEFLMGRSLKNHLYNMGLSEAFAAALADYGFSLEDMYEAEPDAGLGNGGLGRLAACYMDALASRGYHALGYSLRYEYGLFKQKIVDGNQIELPDIWLPGGDVWLTRREDLCFTVGFGGSVEEQWLDGRLHIVEHGQHKVMAEAYDMLISGAGSSNVPVLRLWRARAAAPEVLDLQSFSRGDYRQALASDTDAAVITKLLYPPDSTQSGKELRMKQQYLLVSASVQQIFAAHLRDYGDLSSLPDHAAIHLNDTHPVFCIAEMMRLLLDQHGFSWDDAFSIVTRSVSYTNHTVLAEALESWPENLLASLLPRIYMIIKELDRRLRLDLIRSYGEDRCKLDDMAIIAFGQVRMANLAIYGSHSVNGVSKLHTDILQRDLFKNFYLYQPHKFTNVTNGIAYRRWLCQANPNLCHLLDEVIGDGYRKDAKYLADLLAYRTDAQVLSRLGQVKRANKQDFSSFYYQNSSVLLDPDSIFDVQVKRLHEYKRQLMNALRLISLYLDLLDDPDLDILPRTYIFGAKAAPGYVMAKETIRLICNLSAEVERDPRVRAKLRIVFAENYCVSLAERLMPAAEISEQISLAGKEASGTGNMKLMIAGALTLGTLDGANVEIAEAVGRDNILLFGMDATQVERLWAKGYSASHYYQYDPRVKRVIDRLNQGINGQSFAHIANYLLVGDYGIADPYMCLVDLDDYCRAHNKADAAYRNRSLWNAISLTNIAQAGRFSADRSIEQYAKNIWGL